MSSHKTKKQTAPNEDPSNPEQNILVQIMYDQSTSSLVTLSHAGTYGRAPKVGLKGSRSKKYTWQEKLDARIISRPVDGCWEVSGYQNPHNGYLQISSGTVGTPDRVVKFAHRLAYELAYGPIPDDLIVAHTCDNPRCVRPDHLVATTQAENIHDSVRKGRYNVFGIQKLNAEQVIAIREAVARGENQKAVGARFGVARNTVSQIVNHKTWAHLTAFVDGPQAIQRTPPALSSVFERVKTVDVPIRGILNLSSLSNPVQRLGA